MEGGRDGVMDGGMDGGMDGAHVDLGDRGGGEREKEGDVQ